ncbi:hypothetical protein Taro_009182 [Colocasia esculenta]|uniref:Uncharacterized protein n=1 Tax=Colocasia esculenta TaxID=4460 RepID=A0A843U405_COLES|nr:hypothetical protein [Colocasia esculenta]
MNSPDGVTKTIELTACLRSCGLHESANYCVNWIVLAYCISQWGVLACYMIWWLFLDPSASRPTNDFVDQVSSSGDVIMLTPSTSRPTNNSVGLVSYSGDASCVDAISFKTYGKLRRPGFIIRGHRVTPFMLTPSASRPTENSVGLVSSSGNVDYTDVDSFKTHE